MTSNLQHEHPESNAISSRTAKLMMLAMLIGIFFSQLLLAGGVRNLARPLLFDEILTQTLVADPSVTHSLAAIADGVDFNPPTLHLLLRGYCFLWGEVSETALRSFSLLCALLTLVAVYLTLASVHRPLVACAATLGIWTLDLLIAQAFEARFYSAWCALIAWLCYAITRPDHQFFSRGNFALRAVLAMLICTIHYFGIFSLLLVTVGYGLWHWKARKRLRSCLWSLLPGPLALLACTPFFLGQRAALTVPTWVEPVTLSRLLGLVQMVPVGAISLCAITLYASRLLAKPRRFSEVRVRPTERLGMGVPLASLIFMPAILVAFSLLVQPSMMGRYAIVMCLASAPLMAHLMDRVHPVLLGLCLAILALANVGPMVRFGNVVRQGEQEQQAIIANLQQSPPSMPVIIEDGLEALPLYLYSERLRDRIRFLDFEVGDLSGPPATAIVGRDVLRRYTKHYPGLQLESIKTLDRYERLLVLQKQRDPIDWSHYGRFRVRHLGGRLYQLDRLE